MNKINKKETYISRDVMLRVRMVYVMRFVANHEAVKGAVLVVCCVAVIYTVSIPSVLANVSQVPGLVNGAMYLFVAFLHTDLLVQTSLVLAATASGWLGYRVVRRVVSPLVIRSYSGFRGLVGTPTTTA